MWKICQPPAELDAGPVPAVPQAMPARLGLILALSAWLAALPAAGQSLDYGRFEGLFDEPVTSSATGKPERISDTPVTMDVITADDIRRSGARDLASLLRSLPGVITYRGYNGTQSFSMGALLLNGREIYLAAFDENFLSSIPVELEEIRQIEVVRGPQSALYGFNADQGVINIITFDPAQDPVNLLRGRIGNNALRDGALIATLPLESGIGLRLTASGDHQHDVGAVPLPGNKVNPQNPDGRLFAANFSAWLPNGDHATLEVSHSDVALRAMVPEVTEFFDARLQSDAVKGDYSADTAIGRIGALLSLTNLTVPQASTPFTGWYAFHDHTVNGRLNDLLKIGPSDSVRFEGEVRNEDVHTSISTAPVSTLLLAGSAMWEHQFSADLALVNAVRYVDTDTTQDNRPIGGGKLDYATYGLGDNSALIYKLGEGDSLRASFARGLALPSQLDAEQLGLMAPSGNKATPATAAELHSGKSTEYRLTWDHRLEPLNATGRLSLFHEQSGEAVALLPLQLIGAMLPSCLRPTPLTLPTCQSLAREYGLSGVTDGLEAQLDHKNRNGLNWGANYSVAQTHPHATAASASLVPDLRSTQIFHKVNAYLGYGWGEWEADLRLFYSSPVRSLVLDTTPLPAVGMIGGKDIVALAPRLAWMPRDDLTVELAADTLSGYKATLLQRAPISYFLSVKWCY